MRPGTAEAPGRTHPDLARVCEEPDPDPDPDPEPDKILAEWTERLDRAQGEFTDGLPPTPPYASSGKATATASSSPVRRSGRLSR